MLWHDDQFLYFNFELGHSEAVAPLENCLLGHWVTKDWKAMTRIYCQTLCANSWVLVTRWWVSIYTWTRHRQTSADAQLSQPGGIFRAQATGRPRSLETGNLTLDPLGSSDNFYLRFVFSCCLRQQVSILKDGFKMFQVSSPFFDSLQVAYGPYGIVSYSGHLGTLVNPTV